MGGYIQSGLFSHALVAAVKKASNPNKVLTYAFSKHAAMLSYGNVTYIIRAHKTHISLEVDETMKYDCTETIKLASKVEGVMQDAMKGLKTHSSLNLHLLLENG